MINFYCIGRNNVDVYLKYNMVYPGGNCSNVAAHFAKFGYGAALVTVVGQDVLGRLQLKSLEKLGVDVSGSRMEKGQTAWCFILHEKENRKFVKSDLSIFRTYPLMRADVEHVREKKYDSIYTSVCIESAFAEGVFESLKEYGLPICCDFADGWQEEELYEACGFIQYPYLSCEKCSLEETMNVLKGCVEHGAALALGTRGMEGSVVYDGRAFYHQKAYPISAVDTLGAGDSFLARFSMCYFEGLKQLKMIKIAGEKETERILEQARGALIRYSLDMAALYAAHVCNDYGGFGMGIPYETSMTGEAVQI